jgi:hypothetical protein
VATRLRRSTSVLTASAVACAFGYAAPASPAADVIPYGQVIVRFESNPATCADSGLCGRSGALVWRPSRFGATFELGEGFAFFDIGDGSLVARSVRDTPIGPGVCIDSLDAPTFFELARVPGNRYRAEPSDASALGFGRCAGPLGTDFQSALPVSKPVTTRALRRGTRVDLTGRRAFNAGPFTGSVDSTLVLRTRRARGEDELSDGTSVPVRHGPRERIGQLRLRYAIDSVQGDAGFSYGGGAGFACAPFDSCGLAGDLDFATAARGGTLTVYSYRRLRGRTHETRAAALRALRAGKSSAGAEALLGFIGPDEESSGAVVRISERAAFAGAATCRDTSTLGVEGLRARRAPSGLRFAIVQDGDPTPDHVRTRCPGPGAADLAPDGALAAGEIRFSALGDPAPALVLHPPATFSSSAYRGAGRGAISVSLRLVAVSVSTRTIRKEREPL